MATTKDGRSIKVVALRPRVESAPSPPPSVANAAPAPVDSVLALSSRPVVKWTPSQVAAWVRAQGFEAYAAAFLQHEVDGGGLLELDNLDLQRMGVAVVGVRHSLLRRIRTLAESPS